VFVTPNLKAIKGRGICVINVLHCLKTRDKGTSPLQLSKQIPAFDPKLIQSLEHSERLLSGCNKGRARENDDIREVYSQASLLNDT
jgi:hypothetical protein